MCLKYIKAILIFSLAGSAYGATYYVNNATNAIPANQTIKAQIINGRVAIVQPVATVSPSGPGPGVGSDANPGTYTSPFATITKASQSMSAGDMVIIFPGEYPEAVTNKATGTAGSKVVYKTSGTGKVRWGGLLITNDQVVVDGISKDYLEFTGTNVTGSSGGAIQLNAGAHNIWFSNFYANCPQISVSSGILNPSGISPVFVSSTNKADGSFDNLAITNLIFANFAITNGGLHNMTLRGCDRVLITNGLFSGTNGWDMIRPLGDNIRIVSLQISNYSNPSAANAVHTDILQTFPNNGEHGTNIVLERSIIYNCIGQVQFNLGANLGGTNEAFKGLTVRNNKIYNMCGLLQTYIPNTWVYNNTIFLTSTNVASNPLTWSFLMDASHGDGYNGRCFNNAIVACGNDPGFPPGYFDGNGLVDSYSSVAGSNFSSGGTFFFTNDYNFYAGWPTNGVYPPKRTGGVFFTEPHGINGGDPLFDSTNYTGFNPQIGSPLRGHGTNLTAFFGGEVAVDFNGNARPSTNWCIGAVEP